MRYDLTTIEILNRLGFRDPVGRELLKDLQKALGKPLPKVYREFIEIAAFCPVLETGDVWCGREILSRMEEQKKNGTFGDCLEIGSDYGAGIVTFGLRLEDMDKDDPPVYLHHEADAPRQWRDAYPSVSEFLMDVLLTALTLLMYGTAEEALEELDWEYSDYFMECMEAIDDEDADDESGSEVTEETLIKKGIDPAQVQWHTCTYEGKVFCCWDEEANKFYTGCWDGNEENTLYTISHPAADE